jgi:hypothetical protein
VRGWSGSERAEKVKLRVESRRAHPRRSNSRYQLKSLFDMMMMFLLCPARSSTQHHDTIGRRQINSKGVFIAYDCAGSQTHASVRDGKHVESHSSRRALSFSFPALDQLLAQTQHMLTRSLPLPVNSRLFAFFLLRDSCALAVLRVVLQKAAKNLERKNYELENVNLCTIDSQSIYLHIHPRPST